MNARQNKWFKKYYEKYEPFYDSYSGELCDEDFVGCKPIWTINKQDKKISSERCIESTIFKRNKPTIYKRRLKRHGNN